MIKKTFIYFISTIFIMTSLSSISQAEIYSLRSLVGKGENGSNG